MKEGVEQTLLCQILFICTLIGLAKTAPQAELTPIGRALLAPASDTVICFGLWLWYMMSMFFIVL